MSEDNSETSVDEISHSLLTNIIHADGLFFHGVFVSMKGHPVGKVLVALWSLLHQNKVGGQRQGYSELYVALRKSNRG